MSEEKKGKSEKNYRAIIRARAEQSKGLRQTIVEKMEKPGKSLKQTVERALEKRKSEG